MPRRLLTAREASWLGPQGDIHFSPDNFPEMGLTPLGMAGGTQMSAFMSYWVDVYNAALKDALDALAESCTPTIRLDSAGLMREMVADPAACTC